MSSSIAIPKRRRRCTAVLLEDAGIASESSASSSSSLSFSSPAESSSAAAAAAGAKAVLNTTPSSSQAGREQVENEQAYHSRRPSLLSSSLRQSEHAVVNVGGADHPRLITCVRSSQGFEWNTDMFLPSYASGYYGSPGDLEHRQDPIEDIVLTEEEARSLLPS